jgi:hypothetical protein
MILVNCQYELNGLYSLLTDWSCGGILVEDNGEFASPRWPNQYPSLLSCEWTIMAPPGCTIYLSFTSMELEEHINGNCISAYDRLSIYDGQTINSTLIGSHCGKKSTKAYTSSQNVLYIKFISDDRVQDRGFHAVYRFFFSPTSVKETTKTEEETTFPQTTTELTTKDYINVEPTAKTLQFNASHLSLIAMFVEPGLKKEGAEISEQSQMVEITTEIGSYVTIIYVLLSLYS